MSVRYSVYKKHSANNKLVVYVSRRDIMDDLEKVDPIDGVITIDSNGVKDKKVFARIQCSFRYGPEGMDNVMSGVTFKKEFFISTEQIYPVDKKLPKLTLIQERLIERFGTDAYPFRFEMPHDIPASIVIQTPGESMAQACGIEYHLEVFIGDNDASAAQKHSSVNIYFRRLTIALPGPMTKPYTKEMQKDFHLHSGQLKVEATLPKEIFFHGEIIPVSVVINNMSSNSVRRIKFQIVQHTEVTMFRPSHSKVVILEMDEDDGFPIEAGRSGWCHSYKLRPSLVECRHVEGVALDGKNKHEDTNLATSTLIKDFRRKETMGIIVQYFIRMKVITGFGGRDTEMEIPFILTHPRSEEAKAAIAAEEGDQVVIEKFKRTKVNLGTSMDQQEVA